MTSNHQRTEGLKQPFRVVRSPIFGMSLLVEKLFCYVGGTLEDVIMKHLKLLV